MALTPKPVEQIKDNPTGSVAGVAPVSVTPRTAGDGTTFPYKKHAQRLVDYNYFEQLFLGKHYEAFRIRINSDDFNKAYGKLRYIKANFAGLTSKVVADMLFSEGVKIKMPDDGDQEFVDALVRENKLGVQLYESALSNSYMGDALFKIRIGKRNPAVESEKETVIIEDISPTIYFPEADDFNVRQNPQTKELAWSFKIGDDSYVRKEIHTPGNIINELWKLKGGKMVEQVDIDTLGITGLKKDQETRTTRSLLVHIPNWKTGRRYWGLSDYHDLDALFYALNNRLSMVDNILDKHSSPILFVPEGVLDDKGKVAREALGMIEFPTGSGGDEKPEYIVWNASLENAFKQIENLTELLFMVSETSPDILGMGKGQSDSGRALKLKILRTIAKVTRKKLYYHLAIQEVLYTAQEMAKVWGIELDGRVLKGDPQTPEITWADGLPIDEFEQVEIESKRLEDGTQTAAGAIMNIEGTDEEPAEEKAKAIKDEKAIKMPTPGFGGSPFSKKKEKGVVEGASPKS